METVQETKESALSVESLNKHDEKHRRVSRVTPGGGGDSVDAGSQNSGRLGALPPPTSTTSPMMEKLRGMRTPGSGNANRSTVGGDKSESGSTVASGAPPSLGLKGLLMVKRKMKGWKQSRMSRNSVGSRAKPAVAMENTYKMSPDEGAKFNTKQARSAMEAGVKFYVNEGTKYDARKCAQVSKLISDDIKSRIKGLGFSRYKVVCSVYMGEITGQDLQVVSRCVWDDNTDNFVSYTYKNSCLFCTVCVFGVYFE